MSNYLAEQYLLEAKQHLNMWEFVEAKLKLEQILEMEPGYGRAHFELGRLYWSIFKKYDSASDHLRLAIKLSPEYPVSYYTYAYLLNEINNAEALKRHAIKALQVPGVNKAVIHNELGKSFEQNGNINKALHYYKLALNMSVHNDLTNMINENIERLGNKINMFSLKSLFAKAEIC